MSYSDALNYLAQKTPVVELYDQLGGRLAVCPEWNGRVLTSTCDGLKGYSFGCVNVSAVEAARFEDFGGEDQWTISPLVYPFTVASIHEKKAVLQQTLRMTDARGKPVEFNLTRSVTLLNRQRLGNWFGDAVAEALEQEEVSFIGFRTENTVRSQEKAHIASWQRGMFNASPHAFIVVSTPPRVFVPNDLEYEPFPVEVSYLGGSPHGRLRHFPQALLLRADGYGRCQAVIPYSAAPPILGVVELRFGTLTLCTFDLPGENNADEDIIRIYNSGGTHTGQLDWTRHYELNCFSATQRLQPEESLVYCKHTLHLVADKHILDNLVQQIFDIPLEKFPKDAR